MTSLTTSSSRWQRWLSKTRSGYRHIRQLLSTPSGDTESWKESLEDALIAADMGFETSSAVIATLSPRLSSEQALQRIQQLLIKRLQPFAQGLHIAAAPKPFIILLLGLNGSGKTTTCGKLALRLQGEGHRVMLVAADSFRAAAIEQLKHWGERSQIPVIAHNYGADPAAVCHDAWSIARAKGHDVLLIDTAGRMGGQQDLLAELQKILRVLQKRDPQAHIERLLVLDAGTGQGALQQAQQFHRAMQLSGLILTKIDGSARGGMIFPLSETLRLPIRLLGTGEGANDLAELDAEAFVKALLR